MRAAGLQSALAVCSPTSLRRGGVFWNMTCVVPQSAAAIEAHGKNILLRSCKENEKKSVIGDFCLHHITNRPRFVAGRYWPPRNDKSLRKLHAFTRLNSTGRSSKMGKVMWKGGMFSNLAESIKGTGTDINCLLGSWPLNPPQHAGWMMLLRR